MEKIYRVVKTEKETNEILNVAGVFNAGAVCFYLDNDIDLSKENFSVMEDKTCDFIEVDGSWKFSPVNND